MINEKLLFLTHTDCGIPSLKKHGLGIGPNSDLDALYIQPLKEIFLKVNIYDVWKSYAEIGVRKANEAIIDIVCQEQPRYLLWHSMMYEVLESTFQSVRKQGTLVLGFFSDDEVRFDEYSRWWVPYLDYCLTVDKEAVKRYETLGAKAFHVVMGANHKIFKKLSLPSRYNVTFVGRKFGNRGEWVEQLGKRGVNILAFGRGWNAGHISTDELVKIFNISKINLCLVQSYGLNTRPQLKARIFEICMSGGFLLCEYVVGIEEFFEVGKEIETFRDMEDATDKIGYYLKHEAERQEIANRGWQRAQRDHTQVGRFQRIFADIEKDMQIGHRIGMHEGTQLSLPTHIRRLPSTWHLDWAKGLMIEGYPKERWQEELELALHYDPENTKARLFQMIGYFPAFVRPFLINLLVVIKSLMRLLHNRAAKVPALRKAKQVMFK